MELIDTMLCRYETIYIPIGSLLDRQGKGSQFSLFFFFFFFSFLHRKVGVSRVGIKKWLGTVWVMNLWIIFWILLGRGFWLRRSR